MDIFIDITTEEEADLRFQFQREMEQVLKTRRPMQIYQALNVSRETGRKYSAGQIPTKRPETLRALLLAAVTTLSFNIDYRGEKLTAALLEEPIDHYRQLDLFSYEGIEIEVTRKKTARTVSLELKIRQG